MLFFCTYLFTNTTALGFMWVKTILDTSTAVSTGLLLHILVVFDVRGHLIKKYTEVDNYVNKKRKDLIFRSTTNTN